MPEYWAIDSGELQLFPEHKHRSYKEAAKNTGNAILRSLTKALPHLNTQNKCLHSFRVNASTSLCAAGINETIIDKKIGNSPNFRSEGARSYSDISAVPAKQLKSYMDKLKYSKLSGAEFKFAWRQVIKG